jgi:hypothetical protein
MSDTPQQPDRLDRIEALLEKMSIELDKSQRVFDLRIKALIAADEALQARHEALAESVELIVQSWFRRGGQL